MFLPQPPTDGEKYLYVHQGKVFLYSFGIMSTCLLILGGILFSLHNVEFVWYLPVVGLLFVYLGISYFIGIFSKPFKLLPHARKVNKHRDWRPSVDVYLPCASEDMAILYNTYKYVSQLRWPNLNVYVLDDSGRKEVQEGASWYGFHYISRPNRGELKKSGNMRYAFPRTSGEFILILDADFCPRPDFLSETIPYFLDPAVAIVQTPQYFQVLKQMPWIQQGAGAIQELFYRMIQVNRNHYGASICTGTSAVYRRSALVEFGGTYPIEHSEDVHTGFNLLNHGWRLIYIPIILSAGTCPDTWEAFFSQQRRWCSGSTSLFLNRKLFWKSNITFMQKLCFLSGMLYYQATALGLFVTPLPGLLMVWFHPDKVLIYNYLFSLPSFLFGAVHMKIWNRLPYGISALRTRIISYYAHFFAIKDKIFGTVAPWVPTGDNKAVSKQKELKNVKRLMIGWTFGPYILGLIGCFKHMNGILDFNFYPFLVVSTFHFYLGAGCFFGELFRGKERKAK